jgi:hypothetical protein
MTTLYKGKHFREALLTDEELAEYWSLSTAELEILPDRGDHNRLGFAVLLNFIEIEGCFPSSPREVPAAAFGASQSCE